MMINLNEEEAKDIIHQLEKANGDLLKDLRGGTFEPEVNDACRESLEKRNKVIAYIESKLPKEY